MYTCTQCICTSAIRLNRKPGLRIVASSLGSPLRTCFYRGSKVITRNTCMPTWRRAWERGYKNSTTCPRSYVLTKGIYCRSEVHSSCAGHVNGAAGVCEYHDAVCDGVLHLHRHGAASGV